MFRAVHGAESPTTSPAYSDISSNLSYFNQSSTLTWSTSAMTRPLTLDPAPARANRKTLQSAPWFSRSKCTICTVLWCLWITQILLKQRSYLLVLARSEKGSLHRIENYPHCLLNVLLLQVLGFVPPERFLDKLSRHWSLIAQSHFRKELLESQQKIVFILTYERSRFIDCFFLSKHTSTQSGS
jgi:hypothetical protein